MRVHDPFAFRLAVGGALMLTATASLFFWGEERKRPEKRQWGLTLWQAFWAAVCWFDVWRYH